MDKKIFKGKKVLVMGLGLNGGGVGVAKFFCKQGAIVTVTDLKTEDKLADSIAKLKRPKGCPKIRYVLGKHEEQDFKNSDLIVKNPDVPGTSPYLEIAKKNNIEIETDVGLFFKLSSAYIIGVTGTKGKSTTASLIYHILKKKFRRTFLAGNIGVSVLDLLPKIRKGDKVVLELSSFELEELTKSPNIAVVTNIMPDHLNRYASMEEYIESKKIIFKYQTENDYLVINDDDSIVRQMVAQAVSKIIRYTTKSTPKDIIISDFKLAGAHNLSNLLAVIEVAKILKIPAKIMEKAIKSFKGVPNRQEFIREVGGIKFFNDTTATMPDAAIAAVNSFAEKFLDSKLIFIMGGMDKGLKFNDLSLVIKEKVSSLIMLPGTASDKIINLLADYKNITTVVSMEEAVATAKEIAKSGDVVVLSPAATSFNLFKNEFDRGGQFVRIVKSLK